MLSKPKILALIPFALLLLCGPVTAADDNRADGQWYQIDLIVFKPKNTDIHQETWPTAEVTYPADVISFLEPGFFKLEQLERLEPLPINADQTDTAQLATDEFAFQSRSNQARNRRIIEAVTGADSSPDNSSDNSPDSTSDNTFNTDTSSSSPDALANTTRDANEPSDAAIEPTSPELSAAEQVRSLLETIPDPVWDIAYARTDEDSSLRTIARSLNRSSRYTLLSHYSWVQPIAGSNEPIMIQTGKRFDDQYEVEGTISLSRSRFLHIDTNLWYTRFEPRGSASNPNRGALDTALDDETLAAHADLVAVERERGHYYPVQQYQMVQSRRMRSDELHYIDHPLIGLVIRINRFERPQASLASE